MFQFLISALFLGSLDAVRISGTSSMNDTKGEMWLTVHIVPDTWHEAALMCHLTNGVLASPTTRAIAQAMQTTINAYRLSSGVFIGVTDLLSKGDYRSLDGAPIANIPLEWADGEPNNVDNSQRCLAVTSAGELDDVSCYDVLPYFCRNDDSPLNNSRFAVPMATPPPSSCGYLFGYEWEPRTGSCYKFQLRALNFSQAWKSCAYERAHLVIINSETEANVLQQLFNNNKNLMPVGIQQECVFIGALWNSTYYLMKADQPDSKVLPNDTFVTIQGQTLDAAGFNNWYPGQPDNQNSYEHCASLFVDNPTMNDITCDGPLGYICEFNP